MSQPVKLSDHLILDARMTAALAHRSIAAQIEFWARLGRALEPLLDGAHVLALQKSGSAKPLSALLDSADSPAGRRRVAEYMSRRPFPHYEPHPKKRGRLVRIEEDGRRTTGRFVGRRFRTAR